MTILETKKIVLTPIQNGTAIDHLKAGSARAILDVLNPINHTITVAINASSQKMGRKDLIFIENRFLNEKEINQVALLGLGATHNKIQNGQIILKEKLEYPAEIKGLLSCQNPKCITNAEKITSYFTLSREPVMATCHYCEKKMNENEVKAMIKK